MRILWLSLAAVSAIAADPALTVYNQNFGIVRETVPLDLKAGPNVIEFTGVTGLLEPESVLLRDPSGQRRLVILEQSYRADAASIETMLQQNEGKTIEFQIRNGDRLETIQGKIIRAGAVVRGPQWAASYAYAQPPQQRSQAFAPLIEVDGKLRFELPGIPLFPGLGAGQLKPALNWIVQSDAAAKLNAELSYVSGGFNWAADYNIVQGVTNALEITGWVTIENQTGKAFENASVKLMAGDVQKLQPGQMRGGVMGGIAGGMVSGMPGGPQVTEKTFDEYHLYTLQRPVSLHDKESKQVEFVRAGNVKSELVYVYDGAKIDWNRYGMAPPDMLRQDVSFGSESQNKVWVMREFVNSAANQLGIPLPKGRVRFYRRDSDGKMEFTGEDRIDHTPKDERVRIFTGAAFDLVGERKRTRFQPDHMRQAADESFEVTVRNRKQEPARVKIVEHMYRWSGWEIPVSSIPFTKTDSRTAEFIVDLQPGESKTLSYSVHYQW